VTEAITLAAIPEEIREECRRADINVKSLLLQVVRQPDIDSMREMIKFLSRKDLTRDEARGLIRERKNRETGAEFTKPFTFRIHLPTPNVKVEVKFSKSEVEKTEIVNALKSVLRELEES
jgi:ParB family chromosome partitioning protein